jgi:uncharacterized protein with HEPN domain
MSRRSVSDWLSDIIAWGDRLAGYIAGKTYEGFLDDTKTQDAASKCAEAIGLAANELQRLAPEIENEFPDLQLGLAYRSRNKLSHGYFAVDESILWNTVFVSIPKTVAAAKEAKRKYDHDNAGAR